MGRAFLDWLLSFRAKEAGITIVQEVGLDPGIDHLLAMECIDAIKEEGGKVCGYCTLMLITEVYVKKKKRLHQED